MTLASHLRLRLSRCRLGFLKARLTDLAHTLLACTRLLAATCDAQLMPAIKIYQEACTLMLIFLGSTNEFSLGKSVDYYTM
jgi:hypothetical protein